jgi:beta-glucosidase
MVMAPDRWKDVYENTLAQVRSGEIPQSRIDDAVRRIVRVKAAAGLFERPAPKERTDTGHFDVLGSPAHRAVAREAVRKSLVLLKNSRGVLPLDPHLRVLVAGSGADDIGIQSGGWTVDWQGDHNTNADFPGATSIYAGIAAALARAGGTAELRPDGAFTRKPDVAIVVFGERPYAEFQGDRETLEFSPGDKHDLALLRRLQRLNVHTVSVFISGRPLWVNPEINASDAFVAAWLPGSEGEGIADVLFKAADGSAPFDFTGRLSFSWPLTAMPVVFDQDGSVRGAAFRNGYGLDYRHPGADSGLPLPENPRIPAQFDAPAGSLFFAGHPTAPWSLFVADGDAEVHVTTREQSSPHGALRVRLDADGVRASWPGTAQGALRITGRAVDLQDDAGARTAIDVRYRVDRPPEGPVAMGVACTEPGCGAAGVALLDVTRTLRSAQVGVWRRLVIPMACLRHTGADLSSVEAPFTVSTSRPFGMSIGSVRLGPAGAQVSCPPGVVPMH